MTYILLLDNGQEYSDHWTEPVLWASTKEKAEQAKIAWEAWHKSIPIILSWTTDNYMAREEFLRRNPPPFGSVKGYSEECRIDILEVPEWAEK